MGIRQILCKKLTPKIKLPYCQPDKKRNMKQFILMLGLVLLTATSVNTAQTNEIWVPPVSDNWVPGIYKEEVASGTAEMGTMNDHLKNLEPMIDPKEKECLAKNIYFEAAIESTAGKIAVGQVVLNRINSKYYPDTVCEVVKQGRHYSNGFPVRDRCQFSWYCDGKHDVPYPGQLWKKSQDIAKFMLTSGYEVDITDGALNYHADYIPNPRWAKETNKTVKIDRHIFYAQKDI